jgi:hypothetical protein
VDLWADKHASVVNHRNWVQSINQSLIKERPSPLVRLEYERKKKIRKNLKEKKKGENKEN